MSHLTEGRMLLAMSTVGVHVGGSLAMTLAGIGTVSLGRSI